MALTDELIRLSAQAKSIEHREKALEITFLMMFTGVNIALTTLNENPGVEVTEQITKNLESIRDYIDEELKKRGIDS